MNKNSKSAKYERLYNQIIDLIRDKSFLIANMSTIAAVLHHKMPDFFWTGFYLLQDGELIVGPYQGPVACIKLEKDKGVCWAGINSGEPVIVPDVERFPGHIACDSRSRSEIVIPLKNSKGEIIGVLDVDSKDLDTFDNTDREWLERITGLLF